ncbi:MAG: type III pantothenate kinase [Mariprofundaceae bacterium]|nr:type III pantothenate kinase [Mariprofundaceae bacterium]
MNKADAINNLLCIDVGNTQMVFGLYQYGELISHWRLSTSAHITSDELSWQLYGMFSQFEHEAKSIDGTMVASVVPHLDRVLREACMQVCACQVSFIGDRDVKTGMAVDYKNPREVGADRIANAIAAREDYGYPAIVLDCGTATTFDLINDRGHYAGGLIIPGMDIALAALCKRAAKLPEVSVVATTTLIGRDTISSMQAGSYWASVDGLSGIIQRLHALDIYRDAPVIATGGLASRIYDDMPSISSLEPHLTLNGLYILCKRHFSA